MILTVNDLAKTIHESRQIDAVLLDFQKAFDNVSLPSHNNEHYSIGNSTLCWIADFLSGRTQDVLRDGHLSFGSSVLYGVPRGTVLQAIAILVHY